MYMPVCYNFVVVPAVMVTTRMCVCARAYVHACVYERACARAHVCFILSHYCPANLYVAKVATPINRVCYIPSARPSN
jgi:hypothetical protein